jgi:hypothetical protein
MRWRKHGVVWRPDGTLPWARSHATCATPLVRCDGSLRLFLQSRDARNVGSIGWIDVDPERPTRVLRTAAEPVLGAGAPGCFDDNGVFPTCAVPLPDGRLFLYYVGFELGHHVRYRLLTGLAVSEDGGDTFVRLRPTPVLERSPAERLFRCGPQAMRGADGRFCMFYVAGSAWETLDGKAMPVYGLRYLESADGIVWPDEGRVVMDPDPAAEHGFGRPWVVRDGDGWRMHLSVRRRDPARYRLGFARSLDGETWVRRDAELGLDVSPGEWDGDAIAYGTEVVAGGRTWLFYNGDDFGGTGVGVAELLEG